MPLYRCPECLTHIYTRRQLSGGVMKCTNLQCKTPLYLEKERWEPSKLGRIKLYLPLNMT